MLKPDFTVEKEILNEQSSINQKKNIPFLSGSLNEFFFPSKNLVESARKIGCASNEVQQWRNLVRNEDKHSIQPLILIVYLCIEDTITRPSYGDSYLDKSYTPSRLNDRRHLSELNQEKVYTTTLTRETGSNQRLGSLERENVGSKLLSPEKVLSLRRNSSDLNQASSQPLSSLFDTQELSRSTTNESTRRFASEERSSSLLMSKQTTSNHMASSSISTAKRAVIDKAPNVKGN